MTGVGHTTRLHGGGGLGLYNEYMRGVGTIQQEYFRDWGHTTRVHKGSGAIQQVYERSGPYNKSTWGDWDHITRVHKGSGAIQQVYERSGPYNNSI